MTAMPAASQIPSRGFDPIKYKETTCDQWQAAAKAWNDWTPLLRVWLGPATKIMLDMAKIAPGHRVLDVAAGAGDQTLQAAGRVGASGYVLATDISANILEFAARNAREAGHENVQTQVLDGEDLDVPEGAFDAVISRLGLIYFPDQQKALAGMKRALKRGGRVGAIVFTTPENNQFISIPISIIRRRADVPPPLPGQPGPFSLGAAGVIEQQFAKAGFHDVETRRLVAPLKLPSAAEFLRFAKGSFGALHQMLAGLDQAERNATWEEVQHELRTFEGPSGFEGPCELMVAIGVR
jgi:SAM-dependent methyltransferase